jgi:hypothetical protein
MISRGEVEFPSVFIDATGTDFLIGTMSFQGSEGKNCNRYLASIPTYLVTTITTTLIVKNKRGKTTFTGAALAYAADYSIPVSVDLHSGDQLWLHLSGAAGIPAGGTSASLYTAYVALHLSE